MAPKGDSINSIIGNGSIFQGKFYVEGSLQIDGKFEGDLSSGSQVIIGETGQVKTNAVVASKKVIVAGTMIGSIEAEEKVNLVETGKFLGDIKTPHLEIENGAIFQGNVQIIGKSSESTDIKKVIEDSFSSGLSFDLLKEGASKKHNATLNNEELL